MRKFWLAVNLGLVLSLAGCGGGGGSDALVPPSAQTTCPAHQVEENGVCVLKECTASAQKSWVRAHLDDVYLWYKEIKDVPPQNYATAEDYFDALLVKNRDRFSFTANEAETDAFQESGLEVGYGVLWINDPSLGNSVRIAFVEPGSPADEKGLKRGYILQQIDGKPLSTFMQDEFIDALYPEKSGTRHRFQLTTYINPQTVLADMTAREIVRNPTPIAQVMQVDSKKIGYVLFNDHNEPASGNLVAAMREFKQQQIDELFIDLRYNGGGLLYVADQLASMVAGEKVQNQVFASFITNDKHRGEAENFYFTRKDNDGALLPMLNLQKVYVLTGNYTCSASEEFINALAPFMDVVLIGSNASCGKPYGFLPESNCGTTYFAIQYQTTNTLGQSVPTAGYAPRCKVEDNLGFALGAADEVMFKSALHHSYTGECPVWSSMQQEAQARQRMPAALVPSRASWRNSMIIR